VTAVRRATGRGSRAGSDDAPPRIALLHYAAPPGVGGVEAVLGAQARLLAAAGHPVRIVAGRGRAADPRVEFRRVRLASARHPRIAAARRALDAGTVPAGFATLVAELTAELDDAFEGVAVVIAHNVATMPLNLALTAALRAIADRPGPPALVTWTHDVAAAMPGYADQLHPGPPWDLVRTPWPVAAAVAVSTVRRDDLVRVTGVTPGTIRVVPNGVDVAERLGLHAATRRLVERLGLVGPGPILLTPSRVTPRKNLELAIGVLAALRPTSPGARLVITGAIDPHDGASAAYLGRLRSMADDLGVSAAVALLSDVAPAREAGHVVRDLFQLADALLLTSRDEGFGLPLLEAAVARLPVVCPAIPALVELAGDDATLFSPDAAPAEVARLLEARLAGDEAHRLAVRIRTERSWPVVYRSWIEPLIAEVLAARR
jgi:glycosyltransferase involved in cell wall biosynthesis